MNLATYLRSSWPAVALATFSIAMCGFVLAVSASGAAVSLLACGIVTAGFVLAFAVEYLRRRSFYRTLDRFASTVEHPLWITEAVDRPDFVEGEIVYDALAAVAKAANDDVASYRRQAVDYREYIETWVHEAKSPLAAAHLMLDNLQADPSLDGAYPKLDALDEELPRLHLLALLRPRGAAQDDETLHRARAGRVEMAHARGDFALRLPFEGDGEHAARFFQLGKHIMTHLCLHFATDDMAIILNKILKQHS